MLLIIKNGEFMIVTKQNPQGGPAMKMYPIREDPETGILGYHVGYCPCSEPLLLRTVDVRDIVNKFGWSLTEYEESIKKLKPKAPLRHRIVRFLGGTIGE